ncbi:hypothetical protein VTJ49DRAFT_6563 [Mycothermus thermophilus]|uniref:Uncharacterized protein n=1 Tax=Humicola insolens TaxID=85995 RepID=A0ABR3VKA8_HUMIN
MIRPFNRETTPEMSSDEGAGTPKHSKGLGIADAIRTLKAKREQRRREEAHANTLASLRRWEMLQITQGTATRGDEYFDDTDYCSCERLKMVAQMDFGSDELAMV